MKAQSTRQPDGAESDFGRCRKLASAGGPWFSSNVTRSDSPQVKPSRSHRPSTKIQGFTDLYRKPLQQIFSPQAGLRYAIGTAVLIYGVAALSLSRLCPSGVAGWATLALSPGWIFFVRR